MLISSVFISIKNFSKIVEGNELFNINNKIEDKETISKISLSVNSEISSGIDNEIDILSRKNSGTNSNIANYTGIPLKFKLNNKIYYCDIDTETNLLNNNYEKYENSLIQILYEKDKIINIPFRSLENNIYKVNDIDFLVWEKIITKNRQININIYSKYIFKNKTNCSFQIKLLNPKLENLFILLKPNSYSGIPLPYCNEETSFNFKLIKNEVDISNNESSMINLKEVINNEKYYKKINMKNGSFILKLQHKIEKVKTILLTSEYKIINCLPCDIFIKGNNLNKKIKKCSQFLLDFTDSNSDISLSIKVGVNNFFFCKVKLDLLFSNYKKNNDKNYLLFKNEYGQSFYLAYLLKQKESYKGIEIYSKYIFVNDSGISFDFEDNKIYNIDKNIYSKNLILSYIMIIII